MKKFALICVLLLGCGTPPKAEKTPYFAIRSERITNLASDLVRFEFSIPGPYAIPDIESWMTGKQWEADWHCWFDTMPGTPPRFLVVRNFPDAHNLSLKKEALARDGGKIILFLRVVHRINPDHYNHAHSSTH